MELPSPTYKIKKKILDFSQLLTRYFSLAAFGVLIFDIGFFHSGASLIFIENFYFTFLVIASIGLLFRAALTSEKTLGLRGIVADIGSFFMMICIILVRYIYKDWFEANLPELLFLGSSWLLHLSIIIVLIIELPRLDLRLSRISSNPAMLFLLSFMLLICIGAALLLLPRSTSNGISFIDAFFTSTSAVCVTGLIVKDTAVDFTSYGQWVILILIQLGGLGIMTFTTFFTVIFRGGSSVRDQLYLKEYMNIEKLSEVFNTLLKIVGVTLIIELLGAAIIYTSLDRSMPESEKLWFSVFHAISAFCNAGFSTLTNGLYDEGLRFNYHLQITISFLIIFGGIGFPILFNATQLIRHKTKKLYYLTIKGKKIEHIPRIININTKMVVYTTLTLLVLGTILFFVSENNKALAEHPWYGKLSVSFFGSVTPRTAGFNAFDVSALATSTILVYLLLMWIGGSPGSTAGGIKTTTFAIAIMNVVSLARGKDRVEMGRRQISQESVKRAFAVMTLSFLVIGIAVFMVTTFDPGKELLRVAFECFSAFGTVGLSMNLTPELSSGSKVVIIVTMFLGRVGTLTLIIAFIKKTGSLNYRYPKENIFIN